MELIPSLANNVSSRKKFILKTGQFLNPYLKIIPTKNIRIGDHLIIQMYQINRRVGTKYHTNDELSIYLRHLKD